MAHKLRVWLLDRYYRNKILKKSPTPLNPQNISIQYKLRESFIGASKEEGDLAGSPFFFNITSKPCPIDGDLYHYLCDIVGSVENKCTLYARTRYRH